MINGGEQGVLELDNNSFKGAEGCDVDSLVQDLMSHENVSISPDLKYCRSQDLIEGIFKYKDCQKN